MTVSRHTALVWAWRFSAWAAVSIATALNGHSLWEKIAAAITMTLAAGAVQLTGDNRALRTTTTAIIAATILGVVSVLLAPNGLGEVPVYIAASKIAFPINREAGRIFLAASTVALGAAVGYVAHSLIGALAGLGIPLVAQRAVERRALIAARDQAQALLVEVQAGREAEAQAAALRERGRIARDLHDVLAHSLAGLSVQLQATRAIAARDNVGPAVLEPLDKAAALARDGLSEARAVVSALRDPGGLGIDEIPALVERHPGDVALHRAGDQIALTPEAGHAVYRAVQEALTNAARYAPGSPVKVTMTSATDGLAVCVEDSGLPVGRTAVTGQGSGLGLAGMDERIRAVGGRVTAGPRPDGGWQVSVVVPVSGACGASRESE